MLDNIANKINELKALDTNYKTFGSEAHQYAFYQKINEEQILDFEEKHGITLPKDYRDFLLRFGSGGCGPGYGLLRLENGMYDIPLNKQQSEIITLKKPFRLNSYWNLEEFPKDDYDAWEDEYDDIKWTDGMLRICHLGSGAYYNIIVTGKEKGNIWVDDRGSEGGIYPNNHYSKEEKYDFLTWYSNWLENAIQQLISKGD